MSNKIEKLREAFGLLAEQAKRVIQASMEKNGENDKTRTNTLIDSHIYDEIDINVVDLEMVQVMVNGYFKYIEWGMNPGNWVDEIYLIPWMQDKGMSTDNGEVWYIQKSIYEYGISPRPFIDDAFEMLDEYFDEFADGVINIMLEDIDDWFER